MSTRARISAQLDKLEARALREDAEIRAALKRALASERMMLQRARNALHETQEAFKGRITRRPDPARVHLAIDWRALPIGAFTAPCPACRCVPGDLATHNLHAATGERTYRGRVHLALLERPLGRAA